MTPFIATKLLKHDLQWSSLFGLIPHPDGRTVALVAGEPAAGFFLLRLEKKVLLQASVVEGGVLLNRTA